MNVKAAHVSMVPAGTTLDRSTVNVHLAASWTLQDWFVLVSISPLLFSLFINKYIYVFMYMHILHMCKNVCVLWGFYWKKSRMLQGFYWSKQQQLLAGGHWHCHQKPFINYDFFLAFPRKLIRIAVICSLQMFISCHCFILFLQHNWTYCRICVVLQLDCSVIDNWVSLISEWC